MKSANEFLQQLRLNLSPLVHERALLADYSRGFSPGPGRGSVAINFINLPLNRHQQRRGGGAESENNRQLFMVWGFDADPDSPVEKIKVEQSTNGIGSSSEWAPKMRSKTASPDKIAAYLANYINEIASQFPPKLTHE